MYYCTRIDESTYEVARLVSMMRCHELSLVLIVFRTVHSVRVPNSSTAFSNSTDTLEWWETATMYQIYPRSFMDSDDDGVGDMEGIIGRLDHLKDAGVTATWLSPIFQSPQVDQGYDISDYRAIDPIFGTMEDFKRLLDRAHELGIRVILDFVPNHTSDQHEWFEKSSNNTPGYEDYYIWYPKKDHQGDSSERPPVPNNWISNFKGSAWEWNENRQQYYYHEFTVQQPDLNYSNPRVVQEMKDILGFWLDQGVDGFRIDAVPYLFEDPEFRDQPLADGYTVYDINIPDCLDPIYIKDLPPTFDMIYQFRDYVDEYAARKNTETKVLMTEAYSPMDKLVQYYGTKDLSRKGAHFSFNFNLISSLTNTSYTVDDVTNAIETWLVNLPQGYTNNWVIGNHDNHRAATRLGKENVDGFNMLIALLPGVMVTYNGEEIGMEDGEVTCEQGFDPQAIKDCSTFAQISRDFERTPYQWDNTTNAGFSTANETWLPVSIKSRYLNLAAQNLPGVASHYNVYKALMEFRKNFEDFSSLDSVSVMKLAENVVQIDRRRDEGEYVLLFNVGHEEEIVDFHGVFDVYTVVITSVDSTRKPGDEVMRQIVLMPHESLILRN